MHIFFPLKSSFKNADRKQSRNRQFHLKSPNKCHLQWSASKDMKFSMSSNFFLMDAEYLPEALCFVRVLHTEIFLKKVITT